MSTWRVKLTDGTVLTGDKLPPGASYFNVVNKDLVTSFEIITNNGVWATKDVPLTYRRRTQIGQGKHVKVIHVLVFKDKVTFIHEDGKVVEGKTFGTLASYRPIIPANDIEKEAIKYHLSQKPLNMNFVSI